MHLKYIKLVILKILFILGLCNFKFFFKIPCPPFKQNYSVSPTWNFFIPLPHPRGGACHGQSMKCVCGPADFVTFTEEILNGKHHFLCSAIYHPGHLYIGNLFLICYKNFLDINKLLWPPCLFAHDILKR